MGMVLTFGRMSIRHIPCCGYEMNFQANKLLIFHMLHLFSSKSEIAARFCPLRLYLRQLV